MSLFRLKFYDFVTKPESVKSLERNALELVTILNQKQKAVAMFVKKLAFVNNILVQGINNYSVQMNTIKIGHHSAVRYLRILLNRYYVNSVQIVDTLEDLFRCMSEVEDYKNRIIQYYMLHTAKPLELRYYLMINPEYRNVLMRLLILMQRFKGLYLAKTKETSKILMYMNNILELESKMVHAYKKNPYKLTGFDHNINFIDELSKQHDYLETLVKQFKTGDTKYEKHYKQMMSIFSEYKKNYDIPPIMQNLNHKEFGSYKHLYALYKMINLAIQHQAFMLNRELQDIQAKEAGMFTARTNFDPKMFVMSDPKMIDLLSQKSVVTKHIKYLPQELNLTISELEHCLHKGEGQVEQCIRKHKIAGGGKKKRGKRKSNQSKQNKNTNTKTKTITVTGNNYDYKYQKAQKFINYLQFRQTLDNDNQQIREAIRTLRKIQKELVSSAEMKDAIDNAKIDEANRNMDYLRQTVADMRFKRSDDVYTDQMAYLDKLDNMQKGVDPTMVGGNKPNVGVIKEISDVAWMDIVKNQMQKRHNQVYERMKAQYAEYVQRRLGEGSTKSLDQLLQEAFVQEIYNYVQQELKIGTGMNLEDIKNVTDGKLYPDHKGDNSSNDPVIVSMIGGTNGVMFPKLLEPAVAKQLRTQEKVHGVFKDLTAKLMSLYGPSSRQYNIIQEVINRAVADHKNDMAKVYYMNQGKLEREFLKADIVATRIREDLFSYIDLFPDYDSMCLSISKFMFDLEIQRKTAELNQIESIEHIDHTYAVGMKDKIEYFEKHCKLELVKIQKLLVNLNGKNPTCNNIPIQDKVNEILNEIMGTSNEINLGNIGEKLVKTFKNCIKSFENDKENIQKIVVNNRTKLQKYSAEYRDYIKAFHEHGIHIALPLLVSIIQLTGRISLLSEVINRVNINIKISDQAKLDVNDSNKLNLVLQNMIDESKDYQNKKGIMPAAKLIQLISVVNSDAEKIDKLMKENLECINKYKMYVNIIKDCYQKIKNVSIILGVINDNKLDQINKMCGKGFNEDILKYAMDSSYYGLIKFTETNNTISKFTMKLEEFYGDYKTVENVKLELISLNEHGLESLNQVVTELNSCCAQRKDLIANRLLQKNISKVQNINSPDADAIKARNMQYLYNKELQLKTEKQHKKMKMTNVLDKHRNLIGQQKMKIVSKINAIENIDNLLSGAFKYIIPEACRIKCCLEAAKIANDQVCRLCKSEGTSLLTGGNSQLDMYMKPMNDMERCVSEVIDSVLNNNIPLLNLNLGLMPSENFASLTNINLLNIFNQDKAESLIKSHGFLFPFECDKCLKPLNYLDICNSANQMIQDLNVELNPKIECDDNTYNVIADLLAMEFV